MLSESAHCAHVYKVVSSYYYYSSNCQAHAEHKVYRYPGIIPDRLDRAMWEPKDCHNALSARGSSHLEASTMVTERSPEWHMMLDGIIQS